ncbi:Isochorismatase hydrolase [Setomelanomma holmii]|uniref:Isochorismatase hydrolase n=1 Tax=Setomelanomma holmii TaxID=210430 RepID=A0A9P4LPD1_9PLEO|nr:Isochorismatase hydrolase [Setomelanomma holmii]
MTIPKITPSRTALFLLDYQIMHAQKDPKYTTAMSNAASLIKFARSKGITIAHCRVSFTETELDAIPSTNPMFYAAKSNPAYGPHFLVDAPASQFHPDVAPHEGDIVVRKNRVGPFINAPQDTDKIFKERGIDTLILGGVATGGAVAATVVQASDLDYRLVVVEDLCADGDEETHGFLMKFFSKRGAVVSSGDVEGLIE